jgi:hypothetical protein
MRLNSSEVPVPRPNVLPIITRVICGFSKDIGYSSMVISCLLLWKSMYLSMIYRNKKLSLDI